MKRMSTVIVAIITWTLTCTGCLCVRCYSCVYVSKNSDSQSSCSDPWPWYRETFGDMYKPPVRECPYSQSCMKIVVSNSHGEDSVVRTCGSPCNDTVSSTTTTTCCQGEMCNHSTRVVPTLQWMPVFIVMTFAVDLLW